MRRWLGTLDAKGAAALPASVLLFDCLYTDGGATLDRRSTRLPSGLALRFARLTAIRDDNPVDQVETLKGVRALLPAG
ncbi:MAG: hypothetical protein ACR2NO_05545 [Chloroflexota bacterium]